MKNSPAFQYYPADLLSDFNVIVMTAEEVGGYWLLCSVCWLQGGLPSEKQLLSQLSRIPQERFDQAWETRLKKCFIETANGFDHPRLMKEREKQMSVREARSRAGASGGRPKANEKQLLNKRKAKKSSSSSSSSSDLSSAKAEESAPAFGPHDLATLWNALADPKIARCIGMPDARASHARARIKDYPDPDWWHDLLVRINRSDFLCSRVVPPPGRRRFKLDFDWMLSPTNFNKILQGNYDNDEEAETPFEEDEDPHMAPIDARA